MNHIVVIGDPFTGLTIQGPFDKKQDALKVAKEEQPSNPAYVDDLFDPDPKKNTNDHDDGEGPHLVAIGSIRSGIVFAGPFKGFCGADTYASQCNATTAIVKLERVYAESA